ncbi:hypothetical protein AMECASPLE_013350, partial [Ameca splendens]
MSDNAPLAPFPSRRHVIGRPGFYGIESRWFIYGKLNNAAGFDVSGFIRFSRDRTSLESTTIYSRSYVWMMDAFSSTSVYPGPSFRTSCPMLGTNQPPGHQLQVLYPRCRT